MTVKMEENNQINDKTFNDEVGRIDEVGNDLKSQLDLLRTQTHTDLELKANKTSVATALHRKANKLDVESLEEKLNTKISQVE